METKNISGNSSKAAKKRPQSGADSGFYFKNAPEAETADTVVKDDDFIMTDILLTRSRQSRTGSIPAVKPASERTSSGKTQRDPSMWVVTPADKRNASNSVRDRTVLDAERTDVKTSTDAAKVVSPAAATVLDRDEYEEDSVDISGFFSKRSQDRALKTHKAVAAQPSNGASQKKTESRGITEASSAKKSILSESAVGVSQSKVAPAESGEKKAEARAASSNIGTSETTHIIKTRQASVDLETSDDLTPSDGEVSIAFGPSDCVKKRSVGKYIGRGFIAFGAFLGILLVSVYAALYLVANGPSPTVRNMLVISAKQASATKWMPSLFLSDDEVEKIMADSSKVNVDIMSAEEYARLHSTEISDPDSGETADEWANTADEGIKLVVENGATFKAYVLFVKDPSRIFVGVSSEDFDSATVGMNVFKMTEKYDALAGINGGEFLDKGGMGTGAKPMGMTYSLGECVWDAASKKTFIGFNSDNRLVVREGMDKATATALGIRDGVSFQTGNVLIDSSDGNVKLNYVESNTGVAQRTAIGQREDGTVIMIVTDGRTASSIGATYNDIIDMMVSYGAVNAAMLDGGSSAMLYYENYYDKYGFDKAALDEYQLQGLVNKYKAFTSPRHIPTYFLVKKEAS